MVNVGVSCMGSRERYAIPLALQEAGCLTRLYTDIYVPAWISGLGGADFLPSSVRALLGRNHPCLPFNMVSSQFSLGLEYRIKTRKARSLFELQELAENYGRQFSFTVGQHLKNENALIAFTGEALESFNACERKGVKKILDQVDPGLFEWELVESEISKYPSWGESSENSSWSKSFEKRVESELELADHIIVNSEYSAESLRYWGVGKNVTVLPIPSSVNRKRKDKINTSKPLKVLFLGFLSLRKGVHIALKAIDLLVKKGFEVQLILAGLCLIEPSKLNEYEGNHYLGPVPASAVPELIDSCDVLLFPTLSDGFGMVQVEAISRGIPVITTKNSAAIIVNNESGFIVPASDVEAVARCVEKYCEDRALLSEHSASAYTRASFFTTDSYQQEFNNQMSTILSV